MKEHLNKKVGQLIVTERKLQSISQQELAKLSGINVSVLCLIEKGKSPVTIYNCWLISQVLKISINKLFPEYVK